MKTNETSFSSPQSFNKTFLTYESFFRNRRTTVNLMVTDRIITPEYVNLQFTLKPCVSIFNTILIIFFSLTNQFLHKIEKWILLHNKQKN